MDDVGIGTLVNGKYRIIDKLGEGCMSIVWLSRSENPEKLWAIKEVKLESNGGLCRANIEETRQEVDILKRLNHPALPRIVDVVDDGDSLLVIMDYILGKDLLKRLKERGTAFAEKDVIQWGVQLCDVLECLHTQNPPIIYRDMKPGNVILREDGSLKIIDFGIVCEYEECQSGDAPVPETCGYAPPETFVVNQKIRKDPRSDIYGLGATLFHLVTGHSPMEYITRSTLPPIRSINPALSSGLESVIIKATDSELANRYQSCDELRYELESLSDSAKYQWMRRQVALFKGLVITGAILVILGICLLVGSNMVKCSSNDGLIDRASTVSTDEFEDDSVSEAVGFYNEAIAVESANRTSYDAMVNNVYKNESCFTFELSRYSSLLNVDDIQQSVGAHGLEMTGGFVQPSRSSAQGGE